MPWFPPHVPVGARRARVARVSDELRRNGVDVQPVHIEGRTIARSFWGRRWCHHLESCSDFENRLPRGRAYVRNGSVCHLDVHAGGVDAMVVGSDLYHVVVRIRKLGQAAWKAIRAECAGRVGSVLELLQGRLSDHVLRVVTDPDRGLFPKPGEINLTTCDCPDWAVMCKHAAAVLYGVGSRLDDRPELLFRLRDVDADDLVVGDMALPGGGPPRDGGRPGRSLRRRSPQPARSPSGRSRWTRGREEATRRTLPKRRNGSAATPARRPGMIRPRGSARPWIRCPDARSARRGPVTARPDRPKVLETLPCRWAWPATPAAWPRRPTVAPVPPDPAAARDDGVRIYAGTAAPAGGRGLQPITGRPAAGRSAASTLGSTVRLAELNDQGESPLRTSRRRVAAAPCFLPACRRPGRDSLEFRPGTLRDANRERHVDVRDCRPRRSDTP